MDLPGFALVFVTGLVAGALNVVAGGGSFLTLPVLIFLGLPAGVANATNRVGILLQNVSASWSFERSGVLDRRPLLLAVPPALVGALVGSWAALEISDAAFQRVLALLMVAVTLWTLRPSRARPADGDSTELAIPPAVFSLGFFAAGLYGGFVQAGVGFLILAVTTAAGLDLVRGNAIKVLTAFSFTVVALTVFTWSGRIDWLWGAALGAGMLSGGLIGARLTVLKGHAWLQRVVTATILLFAAKLWFG